MTFLETESKIHRYTSPLHYIERHYNRDQMNPKKSILSFVVFLAILFLSLRYAGTTAEPIRPFILLLFSVGLLIFLSFNKLIKIKRSETLLYIFIIYVFLTVIWSRATSYGLSKIGYLIGYLLFFIVAQRYIILNFKQISLFFLFSNIVFLILFYFTFGNPVEIVSNPVYTRLGGEEANPITYSRFLGLASFFVIYLSIFSKNLFLKIGFTSVLLISVTLIVLSGSKGPLFSFIASVFILILLFNKKVFKKIIYILVALLSLFYVFTLLQTSLLSQFINDRFINNTGSYTSRSSLISNAIETIENMGYSGLIFGTGSGNFAILELGYDVPSYPHNIIVEVMYEYGLIGIILLLLFICVSLSGWRAGINDKIYCFIFALWLYALLNSMVSGDIAGNYLFFGISLLLYSRQDYLKHLNQLGKEYHKNILT